MGEYDLIVIGSGAGMNVASNALGVGMKVAVVEHGLMGGVCLNTGCDYQGTCGANHYCSVSDGNLCLSLTMF